jgi:hypothetical protein
VAAGRRSGEGCGGADGKQAVVEVGGGRDRRSEPERCRGQNAAAEWV